MSKELPVVLVRTWIELAKSNDTDREVKNHALSMLLKAFGSHENIATYMKKHNIK